MRAAGAMDKNDPRPWSYLFLTATLPSNDEWAKWAIAENSGWIVDRLKSWLSKRLKSRLEFYVWEMQGRGALHFHWCLHCPDMELQSRISQEFRLEWMRLLDGVEKLSGVSMWGRFAHLSPTARYCIVQVKVEQIRKSVAAYMAGYCGNKKDKHEGDKFIPYFPKRWFGVCRTLSGVIEAQTEEQQFEHTNLRDAERHLEDLRSHFHEDSVKQGFWCHTVGTGKTAVYYHPPQTQDKLWQVAKMKNQKSKLNPALQFFVNLWLRAALMHSELVTDSQGYRTLLSNMPLDSFQDSLYLASARRGNLRDKQIADVERLFSVLSSRSSLPQRQKQLLTVVTIFCRLHSLNYSRMKYDQSGWLIPASDFEYTVDVAPSGCDNRTTGDESGTPGHGIDGSSGYVPSELTPCPSHSPNTQSHYQPSFLNLKPCHTRHSLH
jgi:hypothetical protein